MSDSTRQSVLFDEGFSRPIVAAFDADGVTSDGGAVLLRAADRRLGLTTALAGCVADDRDSERVVHSLAALIRQRVFSIALGYPQADAARRLRDDPAIGLAVHGGRRGAVPLASQPTLSRLENAPTGRELLAMGDELLRSAVERLARAERHPRRVVIDIDPTVDPAHGEQQGVLFNGFYDTHCYLPVLGFLSAEGRPGHHLFLARLRPGNATAWRATRRPLRAVIRAVRARFPQARILVRLDAAFGRGRLFDLLEDEGVEFVVGMTTNARLERERPTLRSGCRGEWDAR
ncbi:MAG: IS1380 family transposase [Planctomycetia bacterium]|nr:IS1380 family transposase [Planctomycetia bacterium]